VHGLVAHHEHEGPVAPLLPQETHPVLGDDVGDVLVGPFPRTVDVERVAMVFALSAEGGPVVETGPRPGPPPHVPLADERRPITAGL
jgi:hypothetical protein